MRRIVVGTVACLIGVFGCLSSAVDARATTVGGENATRTAAALDLSVHDENGEALDPIQIDLKAGIASGETIVNVHNDGTEPATFGLVASFPGATMTVEPAGGGAATSYTVKAGEDVAVIIKATSVGTPGTLTGHLSAVAGSSRNIAAIKVSRETAPDEVAVSGATTEGIISTQNGPDYRSILSLIPPDGSGSGDAAVAVEIQLTGLNGPDGSTYPLTATHDGKPIPADLKISDAYEVTLGAALPVPGAYKGTMTITTGGKRGAPLTVMVTRTPATLELTITQVSAPKGVIKWGKGGTTISMVVSSTSPVVLSFPTVTLQVGESAKEDVTPTTGVTVDGTDVPAHGTIELTAAKAATVEIKLTEIKEPGAYTGRVEFTAGGVSGAKEQDISFGMRRWRPAFLLSLGIGLIISLLITVFVKLRGKALDAAAAAAPFLDQLDRLRPLATDLDDLALVERLAQDIQDKLDMLDADSASKLGDATFSTISIRIKLLTLVIDVERRVGNAGRLTAEAVAAELETVRMFIGGPPDADQAAADAAIASAQAMVGNRLLGVREVLRDLARRLESRKPMLDSAAATALGDDIKAAIGLSDANEAIGEATALEARLITLFADVLRARANADAPPPGVADWPSLQSRLNTDGDSVAQSRRADVADAQLDLVFRRLIGELVEFLDKASDDPDVKELLSSARVSLGRPGGLSDASGSYDKAAARYKEIEDARKAKEAADAARVARDAELKRLQDEARAKGQDPSKVTVPDSGIAEQADFGPAIKLFSIDFSSRSTPDTPTTRPSRSAMIASSRRKQLYVSMVLASLLSLVIGYGLLYAGNAVWGSDADISAALLWGLGITASGTVGLADVLSKTGLGPRAPE